MILEDKPSYLSVHNSSHSAIRLSEEDILLWSKNPVAGLYTVKIGYAAKVEEEGQKYKNSDEALEWKLPSPLKARSLLWLALANKLLAWDNRQKRRRVIAWDNRQKRLRVIVWL